MYVMLKMADQTISLDRLKINGHVYRLARRLNITVEHEDDRLTLSSAEFGLVVLRKRWKRALPAFQKSLALSGKSMSKKTRPVSRPMPCGSATTWPLLFLPWSACEDLQSPGHEAALLKKRVPGKGVPP